MASVRIADIFSSHPPPGPYVSTADAAARLVTDASLTDVREPARIVHRDLDAARFLQSNPRPARPLQVINRPSAPGPRAPPPPPPRTTTPSPPTPPIPRTPLPPPAGADGSGGLDGTRFLGLGRDQERQRISEAERCRDLDAARVEADLPDVVRLCAEHPTQRVYTLRVRPCCTGSSLAETWRTCNVVPLISVQYEDWEMCWTRTRGYVFCFFVRHGVSPIPGCSEMTGGMHRLTFIYSPPFVIRENSGKQEAICGSGWDAMDPDATSQHFLECEHAEFEKAKSLPKTATCASAYVTNILSRTDVPRLRV
ncbi:hypothetical protein FB451DRAFT_1193395 [Mycena latifolia]|nr:hypothetical protein FB451DRAFT_1193395 [Mycena latifolia]